MTQLMHALSDRQYLFVDAERQPLMAEGSSQELPLAAARITSTCTRYRRVP
jgi:hypothetical protein